MKFRFTGMLFVSLTFTFSAYSQKDLQCQCLENLNITIQKTEQNYAGFPTKINTKTRPAYETLVKKLKEKAAPETSAKKCFYIISEYIKFFKDKHFGFNYRNREDATERFVSVSKDHFDVKGLDPVEGVWVSPDSSIHLAVKKTSKDVFKAIVLETTRKDLKQGLVYFTLTRHPKGFVLNQYHVFTSIEMYAKQRGNLLQLWNFELWGKIYPKAMTASEKKELNLWSNNNNGLDFQQVDTKTTLLKIPTFMNNDNKIEALVSKNDALIRKTENLIVDLRGNGGGNTGWIYFLPYFMTNPVVQGNSFLRISEDNVKMKTAEMEPTVKNPVPAEMKKYFTDSYMASLTKAYEEIPLTKKTFYETPGVTIPLDSIIRYPKKIALIVDDLCGSSAEFFLYLSRQSKKTISYGLNTVGMMDYEGMSVPTPLPLKQFSLTIPNSKSSWTDSHPIDQTGFAPQVKINLPQDQWIKFIAKDLQSRK
jgi:hypothetical protein